MKTYCPYRISPLGAHIDHQYGVVSGGAIDLGIHFEYEELNDCKIILSSLDFEGIVEFNMLDNLIKKNDWADYFRGVIIYLNKKCEVSKGLMGVFKGDLPSGGISSSSASQIAFLLAICKVNQIVITREEIVSLVYQVEKEYMGLSVGILDPSCEVLSRKDSLLFLDTLTNYYKVIANKEFHDKYQFIIIYSGVKRSLIHSKYNTRVDECNRTYDVLNIPVKYSGKLRDVPDYYFERNKNKLSEIEVKRGTHYFSEMKRVHEGLRAWRHNDMITFGHLMTESCLSSIYNYESGSDYLVYLFNILSNVDGVLGTRFLGAGFNGSSLALVEKDKLDVIIFEITNKYLIKYHELKDAFKVIPISLVDGVAI